MAEHQLPKLNTRVRFPSSAPRKSSPADLRYHSCHCAITTVTARPRYFHREAVCQPTRSASIGDATICAIVNQRAGGSALTANFSQGGQTAFDNAKLRYEADLVQEADRFESGARASGAPQEITAQHVIQGDLVIRQGLLPRKRHRGELLLVLGSPAGAFIAGVATNNLNKSWGAVLLVVAVILALSCETVRFVKGH